MGFSYIHRLLTGAGGRMDICSTVEAPGFIDCYKRGHFILQGKDEEARRSRAMLQLAFGQARLASAGY
jgi:hypothetical protein